MIMNLLDETYINEEGKKFVVTYTSGGEKLLIPEDEYYDELKDDLEEKNEKLEEIDKKYNKVANKRKLFFASLFTIAGLGGIATAYSIGKANNSNPFTTNKKEYTVVTLYEDSKGNSYSTTTEEAEPSILVNKNQEYFNKTIFSIYGEWINDGNNYYRTVTTYSVDNKSVSDLLSKKDIKEITESDLTSLGLKKEYSNIIEATSLTEEELNEEPYISIITNTYGKPIELRQSILQNIGDIGVSVGSFILGAICMIAVEGLVVVSSKRLNGFDQSTVKELNNLGKQYNDLLNERNILDNYIKARQK